MAGNLTAAVSALNTRFLSNFPLDAAKSIELMAPDDAAAVLAGHDVETLRPVWEVLAPDVAASVMNRLDDDLVGRLSRGMNPNAILTIPLPGKG